MLLKSTRPLLIPTAPTVSLQSLRFRRSWESEDSSPFPRSMDRWCPIFCFEELSPRTINSGKAFFFGVYAHPNIHALQFLVCGSVGATNYLIMTASEHISHSPTALDGTEPRPKRSLRRTTPRRWGLTSFITNSNTVFFWLSVLSQFEQFILIFLRRMLRGFTHVGF